MVARALPPRLLRHADRDEGRDGAAERRLGRGRSREDDPRRLRGKPRRARRAPDRPLSHSRTRPADAVAHVGTRTRAARGRRPRRGRRRLERQPPAARRSARARSDSRSPGRAQPVRPPRASRRDRRAVRGARDRRSSRTRRSAARARALPDMACDVAQRGPTPAEVALAWLLGSRPRSSRSRARRVRRRLGRRRARPRSCSSEDEAAALDRAFDRPERRRGQLRGKTARSWS